MTINDFLFIILRSALWGHKTEGFELPSKPYRQLYRLSQRQTVSGLLCSALMENNGVRLDRYDAANTYASLNETIQTNGQMNTMVCELSGLLSDAGIEHLIVKGQVTATMYRQPEVRESGDIDFYCPPSCFSQARQLIADSWHVAFEEESESEQHLAFMYKDVAFEMHFNLFKFYNKGNQRYWDSLLEKEVKAGHTVTIGNQQIPTLSPESNILYTFLHLFHHLVELGVGIRQFCDLALAYRYYDGQYDPARLVELLEKAGLAKWNRLLNAFLAKVLECEYIDKENKLPEADLEWLVETVFDDGNFGKRRQGAGGKARRGAFALFRSAMSRSLLFLRYAPREYIARINSLVIGRMKRKMIKEQ